MHKALGTAWKQFLGFEHAIDTFANLNEITKVDILVNLVRYFFRKCWYAFFQFFHRGNRVVNARHGVLLIFFLREEIFHLIYEQFIQS